MRIKIIIVMLLTSATILFALEKWPSEFEAVSTGGSIKIVWETVDESMISRYELERSSSENTGYVKIYTVNDLGKRRYIFNDEQALLKRNDDAAAVQNNTYYYRVIRINKDFTRTISDIQKVEHKVNRAQKTWGMIKEMFR
jgi:hypothetical protein